MKKVTNYLLTFNAVNFKFNMERMKQKFLV